MLTAMLRYSARFGSVAALVLSLTLSGCGAIMDQLRPPPESAPPPPEPIPTPHPPAPPETGKKPHTHSVPPPVSNPGQPTNPASNPGELSGLNETAVVALLGPPFEKKDQGTARVLAWQTPACTFDVIFFMNVKDGSWRVLSWDMDKGAGPLPNLSACYQSIKENPVKEDH